MENQDDQDKKEEYNKCMASYMRTYRQTLKGKEVHYKSCKKYLENNREKVNKRRRERYLERKLEKEIEKK